MLHATSYGFPRIRAIDARRYGDSYSIFLLYQPRLLYRFQQSWVRGVDDNVASRPLMQAFKESIIKRVLLAPPSSYAHNHNSIAK